MIQIPKMNHEREREDRRNMMRAIRHTGIETNSTVKWVKFEVVYTRPDHGN